jgi:hypothetical protein
VFNITWDDSQLAPLYAMPSTFQQNVGSGLQAAANLFINNYGKVYPSQFSHPHIPEWTEKQRKYFFWKLGKGEIVVPYRRTQEVANSWGSTLNGLSIEVGATSAHAPLVQGLRQTMYHKITGWKDVAVAGRDESAAMVAAFSREGIATWVGG